MIQFTINAKNLNLYLQGESVPLVGIGPVATVTISIALHDDAEFVERGGHMRVRRNDFAIRQARSTPQKPDETASAPSDSGGREIPGSALLRGQIAIA